MQEKTIDETRELIELCLNCERAACPGTCEQYRRVRQRIGFRPYGQKLYYELDGERLEMEEWAARIGVTTDCLRKRLTKMTLREALAMGQTGGAKIHTIDGVSLTAAQWAERLKVPLGTLKTYASRKKIGIEKAIRYYQAQG